MYSNRVTLTGFLGGDAEVRTTTAQTSFTTFSLATKRGWKDRESGNYRSETTWHRCICFGKVSQYAATLTKGAHVLVEGQIRTREYTSGGRGETKSVTEIRVLSVVRLDRKSESPDAGAAA